MATQVKVGSMGGVKGLLLHRHGDGPWHPACRTHTKRAGENLHEDHTVGSDAEYKSLDKKYHATYKACLEGVLQEPFQSLFWGKPKVKVEQVDFLRDSVA